MSHPTNDEFLQSAQENFLQALEEDNVQLANDIIKDVTDKGFTSQAIVLSRNLNEYLEGKSE